MLRFKVIVVDRTRAPFIRKGEAFYLERLRRYVKTEWVEVKPVPMKKGRPEADVIREEGTASLKHLKKGDIAVALDRSGTELGSRELAMWLERLGQGVSGTVCFLIGGPLGHGEEVLQGAGKVLSLSRLTLTHEMARLVLLEQLYRACTIMAGEKYHK